MVKRVSDHPQCLLKIVKVNIVRKPESTINDYGLATCYMSYGMVANAK